MQVKPIQDYYPDELSYCYGCGRNNEHGHHIKSYWDGDETISHFYQKNITLQFRALFMVD